MSEFFFFLIIPEAKQKQKTTNGFVKQVLNHTIYVFLMHL